MSLFYGARDEESREMIRKHVIFCVRQTPMGFKGLTDNIKKVAF
jgi:hypothetical protein